MFPAAKLVCFGLAALSGLSSVRAATCGPDTSVPAKCYLPNTPLGATIPLAYERARAVVRTRRGDTTSCTGFLVGSEGHVLTPYECTNEQSAELVGIEFGAESASCADQCQVIDGCRGNIVANSTTFVAGNADIDYTILKLPSSVDVKSYGYLQLRESGAIIDEQVYLVTHPERGMAKRIVGTRYDGSAAAVIESNYTISCTTGATGVNSVYYQVDPNRSAGAPVISAQDNTVVAIHNCGNCDAQNSIPFGRGIDVRDVIRDLKAKGIVIKDLVSDSKPTPLPSTPGLTPPVPTTPAPTTPAPTTPAPTTPAQTTKSPSTCKDASA